MKPTLKIAAATIQCPHCTGLIEVGLEKMRNARTDWKSIDWSLPLDVIAKETGLATSYLQAKRREITGITERKRGLNWSIVDWTDTNDQIAAKMQTTVKHVRTTRYRLAPRT